MSWTLEALNELLAKQENLSISLENEVLFITNEDGIDAYLTISGDQILVESLLCLSTSVKNEDEFNRVILRTHKQLFPLTSIGLTEVNGLEYYAAFGALSSQSKEESILIEVDFLFQNVTGMLECYDEFFN